MAWPDGDGNLTPAKRIFDVALAALSLILLMIPALFIAALLLLCQGQPIFYLSERMKSPDKQFLLYKFRTMDLAVDDGGVSGGNKIARITPVGRILRRTRLDETPQLWNILCGEMSFVGPRPPLPIYVDRFPAIYAQVLQTRPGLTGLATLAFHKREAKLLENCQSAIETDTVYVRRCIPRKARIDMIYLHKRTLLLDMYILSQTVLKVFQKHRSA